MRDMRVWALWISGYSAVVGLVSIVGTWVSLRRESRARANPPVAGKERQLVPPDSLRQLLTGDADVLVERSLQDAETLEVLDAGGAHKTYEPRYTVLVRRPDSSPAGQVTGTA